MNIQVRKALESDKEQLIKLISHLYIDYHRGENVPTDLHQFINFKDMDDEIENLPKNIFAILNL